MSAKIGATFDKTLRERVFLLYTSLHSFSVTLSITSQSGTSVTVTGTLSKDGVGLDSKTITIYDGDTVIDECTTTDGVYSTTLTLSVGEHTLKAVSEYGHSAEVPVTVSQSITSLSIDVPLVLVYSDEFSITGTLKDSNNEGISGATVSLKVGSTVVDSTTTTTDGGYSFTQTPVTTGNHTFQVVYVGDSQYIGSESSVVSRVVGKETSVLSVTNPTNNLTVYTGESVSVSGSLLSDDGEALSSKTILVKESGTTLTTFTTDSNGAFTGSISNLSVATHTLSFEFETDTYYTASTVTRTVNVIEHSYDIDISTTTPIVQNGSTATIVATLTDNGEAVSGQTLSYQIKHGNTVIDSGTDTTSIFTGQISFTYLATGVGDVDIIVSWGSLLQETYELQDCYLYDDATSDKSSNNYGTAIGLRNSGTASLTYSSDGYYGISPSKANSESFIPINSATGLDDFIIEYDGYLDNATASTEYSLIGLTTYLNNNNWLRLGTKVTAMEYGGNTDGSYFESNISGTSAPRYVWLHFKFTITNNTIHREVYNGSTLLYEDTKTTDLFTSTTQYGFPVLWNTSWKARFKNLIVKAL